MKYNRCRIFQQALFPYLQLTPENSNIIPMNERLAQYNQNPQTPSLKLPLAILSATGNRQQATGNRQQATGNYTHFLKIVSIT
jgi:hypothetical protein